jgi:hypothetical protein
LAILQTNPEGIASLSPGLRAERYPGGLRRNGVPTLKGLHHRPDRFTLAATPQSSPSILVHYELGYDERSVWDCAL